MRVPKQWVEKPPGSVPSGRTMGLWIVVAVAVLVAVPAWSAGVPVLEPVTPAPGEVFRVQLAPGTSGADHVEFDGRVFSLWPTPDGGWAGLVSVDRDEKTARRPLEILGVGGACLARLDVAIGHREYATQRLTVNERTVTLSPEDRARADRERPWILAILGKVRAERLWSGAFTLPVDAPVSSPFGTRRFYNGKRRGYHSGLDLAAGRGTPVRAPAAGRVAGVGDLFYTGRTVFLDHGYGLLTAYFHLDRVEVAEGDLVEPGDVLGQVGSTGRSTGPHLHWGVYLMGRKVDPLSLVRLTDPNRGAGKNLDARPGGRE